ncbi:MAG TPA: queuosine precursor transporter [Planctomycetota bacterium]|nr:queuosine precursor transporter [Planctomycetota bacterium]
MTSATTPPNGLEPDFADPEQRPLDFPFLALTAVFLASLIVCNLIASKFLTVDLGFRSFTLSAGALPYPVTFLATDLLSEIYGKRRANLVVWSGFVALVFVLVALWLGHIFPAIPQSRIDDATYTSVFSNAPRVILASMTAYLVAQFVDVRLFHFWRELTNGRHLWLRNNASTILSQLLDSLLVVLVLFWGSMAVGDMAALVWDLWLFKLIVALADTPFFYWGTWWLQRWRPRAL